MLECFRDTAYRHIITHTRGQVHILVVQCGRMYIHDKRAYVRMSPSHVRQIALRLPDIHCHSWGSSGHESSAKGAIHRRRVLPERQYLHFLINFLTWRPPRLSPNKWFRTNVRFTRNQQSHPPAYLHKNRTTHITNGTRTMRYCAVVFELRRPVTQIQFRPKKEKEQHGLRRHRFFALIYQF